MKYAFIDIVRADAAFDAFGKDYSALFANSGEALSSVMVDLKTLSSIKKHTFSLQNKNIQSLLYDFLEEIIFVKDAEQLLFNKFKVTVAKKKVYELHAECVGDKINTKKQKLGVDVKAITLHDFKISKTKDGYKARIVVDV